MDHCVILVTVPDQALGRKIAEALVTERLAACVNQVPGLFSVYRWQGRVEKEPEELLLIKTRKDFISRVSERVRELHTYQLPEIIALPIVGGSQPYLEWVTQETEG
jgi:periplasmic divalent cation tolerance protein